MLIRVQLLTIAYDSNPARVAHFNQSASDLSTPSASGASALAKKKKQSSKKTLQALGTQSK